MCLPCVFKFKSTLCNVQFAPNLGSSAYITFQSKVQKHNCWQIQICKYIIVKCLKLFLQKFAYSFSLANLYTVFMCNSLDIYASCLQLQLNNTILLWTAYILLSVKWQNISIYIYIKIFSKLCFVVALFKATIFWPIYHISNYVWERSCWPVILYVHCLNIK